MIKAGNLREKLAFDRRDAADDGAGNFEGNWAVHHVCAADIRDMRGGEGVIAARLTGTKPAIITIRDCVAARQITPGFRARDMRRGTVYNIRDVTPSRLTGMIDLLAETGVAHG